MSGFLDRLALRATAGIAGMGGGDLLRPRVRSRFEPDAGALIGTEPPVEPMEELFEARRAPVEAEAPVPRRERRPTLASREPTVQRQAAGPVPVTPPVEPERVAPTPRRPEAFSVAWPVLDDSEVVETAAPAPRVTPRGAPKAAPPARREEDPGRLEPRAKRPFPLGGGGLDQGEGQDGGGPREGNLNQRESLDGGRARLARTPHPLTPSPIPSPLPGEGERRRGREGAPLSRREGGDGRGDGGEGPLPTLAPRGELSAELPVMAADEPAGETVIRVNIGQIDVRMPQPPAPAPRPAARPAGPRLTLADYLKARQERRR